MEHPKNEKPGGSERNAFPWKKISKGDIPPKDKQVLALINYGYGHIGFQVCYGIELTLGRKQDQYREAPHARDDWCEITPPAGFRWSNRLNKWIDIENR